MIRWPDNSRWFRRVLLLLAGVSVVFAAGCGGDDGSSGMPETLDPVPVESLTGKTFNSTEVTGHELVSGTEITISFGPGALTASAGCNSIRGAFEFADDVLTLGKAAGTLLGCPGDRQKQDEWLTDLLTRGVEVSGRDQELMLKTDRVSILMKEGSAPGSPPPVIGTTWELNSYDADGTAVSMKPGVRLPFVQFRDDDSMKLFDGCNSGTGRAQVNEDGSMVFGPRALTRKACPGLSGDVSQAISSVMKGRTAYAFEGQNLIISRQGTSLSFAPG